jgi:GTPase SAR1 family protein
MNTWVSELKNYMPSDIPIMIAGNKADLTSKVIDEEKVNKYAKQHGM